MPEADERPVAPDPSPGGFVYPFPETDPREEQTSKEWRYVWFSAIALAWKNEEFKQRLLTNAREALEDEFGWQLPGALELEVVAFDDHGNLYKHDRDGSVEVVADKDELDGPYGWMKGSKRAKWVLPPSVLRVVLPPPPAKVEDEVLALANYAAAGRTYPFTII